MKETMIYVCISFVTFEHPLYSYIFLHRGRFVYCPFLLVRFNLKRLFSLQDFNPFSWKKKPEPFAEQIDEKVLRSAAGECVIYSHTGTSFAAGFYFAQQFQPFAYGFFRSAMMLCQTGNIRAAAKFL